MDIVVATVNPVICKTFLDTLYLLETRDLESPNIHVFIDDRNTSIENFLFLENYKNVRIYGAGVIENLLNFLNPTEKELSYIEHQTHHFKIAVMLHLFRNTNLRNFVFMDDDTVVLKDLRRVFSNPEKITAFYMRSFLYYYHKSSKSNMKEFSELLSIAGIHDPSLLIEETSNFWKIGQYNAGHFSMLFLPDFEDAVFRFYKNIFLKNRFFEEVWDYDANKKRENIEFFNRSFFDEQRFLTFYFLKNRAVVDEIVLNRKSPVYMSYREDEFRELFFDSFAKKMKEYSIIHYVGKEKLVRSEIFQSFVSEKRKRIF